MIRNFKLKRILVFLFAALSLSARFTGDNWDLKASLSYSNYIDVTWKVADKTIDSIKIFRARSVKTESAVPKAFRYQCTVAAKSGQLNDNQGLDADFYYYYQIRAKSDEAILSNVAKGAIIKTATGHLSNVERVCPSDLSLDSAKWVRSGVWELSFRYECPKPKTTSVYLVKADYRMLPLKIQYQDATHLQVKVPRYWQNYQFWKVAMDGKMDSLSIQK